MEVGRFIIKTNHESLKFLLQQKLQTQLQKKRMAKLMGLDYSIQYKKGNENLAADALLRCQEEASAATLTVVIPKWCKEVVDNYERDDHIKGLLKKLALGNREAEGYTMVDGLLRYKGKIVVGPKEELKRKILQSLHESLLGGHSSV